MNRVLLQMFFDGTSDLRPDFRLSRTTLTKLTAYLRAEKPGCSGWGLEIEVLVFMFWLASATSYRVVARAFDIPRTTVHDIVHKERVISFPCAMELHHIRDGFAQLAGSHAFSKVVGSIDGCQVQIKPPSRNQSCYLNRNFFSSSESGNM